MKSQVATVPVSGMYAEPRQEWLSQLKEDAIDPAMPIIDPHHHLWSRAGAHYMTDEVLSDMRSGHHIAQTVYIDCRSMYRQSGPEHLKPLGEVEFANGIAAISASGFWGDAKLCEGIVGHCDLRGGALALDLLERSIAVAGHRYKGIRQVAAWVNDPLVSKPIATRPPALLLNTQFRQGFQLLAKLNLSFDAFVFHTQLFELLDLAQTSLNTPIVIDHVGGPIGIGSFANQRNEVFEQWKSGMKALAGLDRVYVKLSGFGMLLPGFKLNEREKPATSTELAALWRPYMETCIELFGTNRCMFASNFPPDKGVCSYVTLWNAFKKMVSNYSETEKKQLFHDTAKDFYRLS